MNREPSALTNWSDEEIAQARRWVETWKLAGPELERIRREELRQLDGYRAIKNLCGPLGDALLRRASQTGSGLIEQQRWFRKAAGHD